MAEAAKEDARKSAWTAYWAAGGLHSCTGSFDAGYSGAIGAFWADQFMAMTASHRVLDLATGNGALPLLLHSRDGGATCPSVDAVDLAEVAPGWHQPERHGRIRFHSGVAMEQLPFEDDSMDMVVSQFGFEYARRTPALRECMRVLKPTGRIAMVMHHAGSVLARVGRAEMAHQARLFQQRGLLATAAEVLPWFARARAGEDLRQNAHANAARAAYNAAVADVSTDIDTLETPDLLVQARDEVHRILVSAQADAVLAQATLARFGDAVRAAGLRSAEMLSHALDVQQAEALVRELAALRPDATVSCRPLAQSEGVLGWALELAPAPPLTD
jgi:ubiquinone/menaquinone biosynthesis C-methylase UbiE